MIRFGQNAEMCIDSVDSWQLLLVGFWYNFTTFIFFLFLSIGLLRNLSYYKWFWSFVQIQGIIRRYKPEIAPEKSPLLIAHKTTHRLGSHQQFAHRQTFLLFLYHSYCCTQHQSTIHWRIGHIGVLFLLKKIQMLLSRILIGAVGS